MSNSEWSEWLSSGHVGRWPATVGELLPGELASACLLLENDPLAERPLDATGHLSLGRLDVLFEILQACRSDDWLVAYWDGWSRIETALKGAFQHSLFSFELPLRRYLAARCRSTTYLDWFTPCPNTPAQRLWPPLTDRSWRSQMSTGVRPIWGSRTTRQGIL